MAYLNLGLTSAELAERFHTEAPSIHSDAELEARFGPRRNPALYYMPYAFLESDVVRNYSELNRKPDWTDQTGRQYFRHDAQMPATLELRLPKSVTMREDREDVPVMQRQDFPRPGEVISLRGRNITSMYGLDALVQAVTVPPGRRATALITLAQPLPSECMQSPPEMDIHQRRRLEDRVQRKTQRLEQQQQQDRPSRVRDKPYTRPNPQRWRAPKAPGIPKK
jgi:hypothetical protein